MEDFDRLTSRIGEYVKVTGIPAFALGVVRGGDLIYAHGFGRVRRDGSGDEVTPDTAFPSCSSSRVDSPSVNCLPRRMAERQASWMSSRSRQS